MAKKEPSLRRILSAGTKGRVVKTSNRTGKLTVAQVRRAIEIVSRNRA